MVKNKNTRKTMYKSHNKRKGSAREQNLLTSLWDNGYVVFRMSLSAGGYPLRIFREKFPTIYKRTQKNVKPIDLDVTDGKKRYFLQVSKYYDHISSDEITVLCGIADDAGAIPVLGWMIGDKFGINHIGWKFCEADSKIEIDLLNRKSTKYEKFCEKEKIVA